MLKLILNSDHLDSALADALDSCRYRLFIMTADVKDVHIPTGRRRSKSILRVFRDLGKRGVEVRLLHSGVPSGPFLEELKQRGLPETLTMRRCPRVHTKVLIADGVRMYLGSANLTGAGLGAKSPRRRNFEAGIWTDDVNLIDPMVDEFMETWSGSHCIDCGRRKYCPAPLEEPPG
ncbi:MAG: phospholipase D family protein [Phycisphaerae bacterium]